MCLSSGDNDMYDTQHFKLSMQPFHLWRKFIANCCDDVGKYIDKRKYGKILSTTKKRVKNKLQTIYFVDTCDVYQSG